jgi:hypothetical protein
MHGYDPLQALNVAPKQPHHDLFPTGTLLAPVRPLRKLPAQVRMTFWKDDVPPPRPRPRYPYLELPPPPLLYLAISASLGSMY